MTESLFLNSCMLSRRGCSCFEKLSPEECEQLARNQVELTYKKGEILTKQGSSAPHVIFLVQGLVKAYLEGSSDNLVLKIISGGKFVALSSATEENNVFRYSTQAYVDSIVRLIDMNFFKQLMRSNAEFATEVFNIQSANAVQIYGRFFCITQKQSYGRLADILLCLADNVFGKQSFELELSRKEIAELSGMAEESVVRIIKKFKEDGLISTTGKTIEIVDYEKLRKISVSG
jgi:CRP/FNR family transcriptional regulator, polysaccharide utilization system transcription regulator